MKVEDCVKCEAHVELLSDSVLCRYRDEMTHRVISNGKVVGCPIQPEKKGLRLFRKNK